MKVSLVLLIFACCLISNASAVTNLMDMIVHFIHHGKRLTNFLDCLLKSDEKMNLMATSYKSYGEQQSKTGLFGLKWLISGFHSKSEDIVNQVNASFPFLDHPKNIKSNYTMWTLFEEFQKFKDGFRGIFEFVVPGWPTAVAEPAWWSLENLEDLVLAMKAGLDNKDALLECDKP